MKLTREQLAVVALDVGRHLVLAPPGSGKTEMLSQRILRALTAGVRPEKMLCATFTNRAAYEMRDRVTAVAGELALPEVGNLHHFCHRFLLSVGRLHPGKYVLDEMQQLEFVKEVVDVLRGELQSGTNADLKRTHGLAVMNTIKGICEPMRVRLHEEVELLFADAERRGVSAIPDILTAAQIVHQRKCGIPTCYLRQVPPSMYNLTSDGVIDAIEIAYRGLKRKFRAVDFDDLVNETYLFLAQNPIPEERRFDWVQVDEVQDLNPLQWRIVRELTSSSSVSVYFGDVEQSIFSFLGASSFQFAAEVADCTRHFFKTNFRATPLLLEILMRYSLDVLRSEWEFLPAPSELSRDDGEVRLVPETSGAAIAAHVHRLLDERIAENVAVLVRDNRSADMFETVLRPLGYRTVKVSGIDLFSTAPMRDFLAFVSLFGERPPRIVWAALFRRFAEGIFTRAQARYFVRGMFAAGFDPLSLLRDRNPVPLTPLVRTRAMRWAWSHRRALSSFRAQVKPFVDRLLKRLDEPLGFRDFFAAFSELALGDEERYSRRELWPELRRTREELAEIPYSKFLEHAVERIEVFLRYVDFIRRDDGRSWRRFWDEEGARLSKLKEADLLVGDEKIVISTIHKAKGRQFDAVVVPEVASVVATMGSTDADEPLRLLYVAMSRAKRHLALFGCVDDDLFAAMRDCFEPGYVSYYRKRERGVDLSGDWLSRWEILAAHNSRQECPQDVVEAALSSGVKPLVRMALKVLRHDPDREFARKRLLDWVGTEFGDTAVVALADGESFDHATVSTIRSLAVASKFDRVRHAALAYCRRGFENVADPAARPQLLAAVGDALYAASGEVRHAAAGMLAEQGDGRFERLVTGAFADFGRLAAVRAPEHEPSIRAILATHPSERHETALREILYKCASQSFR